MTQTAESIPLTIAIPTYNRSEKVTALVRSIIPQLGPGDELLVVDDCSPDKTAEMLGAVPGVRLERHASNQGMVKNWNSCFELATNDWVCIIHDDDVVSEDAIATLRKTCSAVSRPSLISHPWGTSTKHGGYHYRVYAPGRSAVMSSAVCPSGAVIHKAIYKDLGGFNENFMYSSDVEYFARLTSRYELVIVDSPAIVTYQFHEDNYQYETWLRPDFWRQWENISRCVLLYAGLDGVDAFYEHRNYMVRTLRYILRTAAKRKDRTLLRMYGRIAMSKPEYGGRMRFKGLIAATLGHYA